MGSILALGLTFVLAVLPQPPAQGWPAALTALVFTSRSGASISVERLVQYVAPPQPDEPHALTDIRADVRSGLVEACSAPCAHASQRFVLELADQDPPPSAYDHGFRATIFHAYALRDGIVVAHAYHFTEN